VEALQLGGFDLLSLANNHSLDYGSEGLIDGMSRLNAGGIRTVGAGENLASARQPELFDINGLSFAFLSYANVPIEFNGFDVESWEATADRPGLAWGRVYLIADDVRAIRDEVDHVIVLLHTGTEYQRNPSPIQRQLSEIAIVAGATLVVNHHTHVLQPIEPFSEGIIAYGLGNFAFDIDGDPASVIMQATFDRSGLVGIELIPAVIVPGGRPRPATPEESQRILDLLEWNDQSLD
ncbi:MAG: CapA family protein, partial [Chloroflexota bacterium]